MHKDLITYELAEGVTEEHLLSVAERIITEWMRDLDGFISWEIHKTDNGYADIVCWRDAAAAHAAEKNMVEIPNAAEWYGCYKEGSIQGKKLTRIAQHN